MIRQLLRGITLGSILVLLVMNPAKGQNSNHPGLKVQGVEKLATHFLFVEGPVWHHGPQSGSMDAHDFLYFSDIPANLIYKWSERLGVQVFRTDSSAANGNTLDLQGRLITCEGSPRRRVVRANPDGSLVTLADRFEGKRLNAPNDVVVKSDGTIYFTDPPYSTADADLELNFFGVYRIDPTTGALTAVIKDFVRPNGLTLSPDETKLYVNDSCSPGDKTPTGSKECVASGSQGLIKVYDIHSDGSVSNGRVLANLVDPTKHGVPDGMKTDTQGNVYCTGPGGVWVVSPAGKILGRIEIPEVAANVAWGPANWPMLLGESADYHTLFVTASTSLYRVHLKIPGCGRC